MSANYIRGALKSSGSTIVLRNGGTYTLTLAAASLASANRVFTFPDVASDTVALVAATQTLTNKTLTAPALSGAVTLTGATTISGAALTVLDSEFTIQDQGSASKTINFQLSGLTSPRTWTFPNDGDTFVGLSMVQTLQNKTLTSCVISSTTTGTLTASSYDFIASSDPTTGFRFSTDGITVGAIRQLKLPNSAADTLVGAAATQDLTNKTVNKVTITAPATSATLTVADGKTLTANASITLTGTDATQLSLAGNLTTSGANALTLTTSGATNVTLPTTGTLATLGGAETFSGVKSFSAAPKLLDQTALRFYDSDSSHYVGLKAPATTTANLDWTLPSADGTTGQVLKTDGSGALGWVSALTNPATAAVTIDGSADEVQLTVQGNATQTSNILVVEKSDGTDLLQVTNTSGTNIRGTTTNDSAATGFVGEFLQQSRVQSAAQAITTATATNVTATALTLTAGDWDIFGAVAVEGTASTSFTGVAASISKTSATLSANDTIAVPTSGEVRARWTSAANVAGNASPIVVPLACRASISSTTTFYLVVTAIFTVSTATNYGSIWARRVR